MGDLKKKWLSKIFFKICFLKIEYDHELFYSMF